NIIACSRLRRGVLDGGVVGTKMTNFGLEHALNQHGIDLVRTDVGDRYILERLQIERWSLGGEPSGHIICLDRTTTGDGIISALQVLAEVVKSGRSLHELRDGYLKYPQVTLNVKLGSANAADLMKAQAVQDSVDSVATELADTGRVLLRPSGTEPLIRVTVEGRDAEQIMAMASRIANLLETMVSGESDNRQVASV
ncbi:MAG: phosphoglucosamine mutase, partial [Sedimenticola sp.]|nr:phosphoglucosamine mutase [Sedimenticola sp.]